MKVVDTTLLIDHARGETAAGAFLDAHEDDTLVASAISLSELAVGEIMARSATIHEVLSGLGAFDVRAFTAAHAYHAAAIEAALRDDGAYRTSLATDVLIGGVARSLDVPLVTRSVDDFQPFDGVVVEGY